MPNMDAKFGHLARGCSSGLGRSLASESVCVRGSRILRIGKGKQIPGRPAIPPDVGSARLKENKFFVQNPELRRANELAAEKKLALPSMSI